jgi:hypothetical protein
MSFFMQLISLFANWLLQTEDRHGRTQPAQATNPAYEARIP